MGLIFISHSSRDNEAAVELKERLRGAGHESVFLDFDPQHGIPAGADWERELYARLRACQAVVVLCSPHSMESEWCFAEITHARAQGKVVFPVVVSPCTLLPLLQDSQAISLTSEKEEGYARLFKGLRGAGLDPRDLFVWHGNRSPYPGLHAFEEEDAAVFFGQEGAIRTGLERLRHLHRFGGPRCLLILGASGSGKSSLMRAGLVPRLRRDPTDWVVVGPFRPRGQAATQLGGALAKAFGRHGETRGRGELEEVCRRCARRTPVDPGPLLQLAEELRSAADRPEALVVLALDQLEELLGHAPSAQAEPGFLPLLRALIEAPGTPFLLLATLRSDFLGALQSHPAMEALDPEDLLLGPMGVEGFARVIEGPARTAGVELEDGLVQAMVGDTQTADALPLLAFTLRELWEGYADDHRLDVREYRENLGGLHGSVGRAAEGVMRAHRAISEAQERVLKAAFLKMARVNEEGRYARVPVRWSELPGSVVDLLERFVEARLLVSSSEDAGGERSLEVAHESLFRSWDKLATWLDEDREFLLWRRRFEQAAAEWAERGRDGQYLLRGGPLTEAEHWLREHAADLRGGEQDFIEASVALRERERGRRAEEQSRRLRAEQRAREEAEQRVSEQAAAGRRLRRGARVLAVVASLALVAGGFAWNRSQVATQRLEEERKARVGAQAAEKLLWLALVNPIHDGTDHATISVRGGERRLAPLMSLSRYDPGGFVTGLNPEPYSRAVVDELRSYSEMELPHDGELPDDGGIDAYEAWCQEVAGHGELESCISKLPLGVASLLRANLNHSRASASSTLSDLVGSKDVLRSVFTGAYSGVDFYSAVFELTPELTVLVVATEHTSMTCGSGGCGTPTFLFRVGPGGLDLMAVSRHGYLEIIDGPAITLFGYTRGQAGVSHQGYGVDGYTCAPECVATFSRSIEHRVGRGVDMSATDIYE